MLTKSRTRRRRRGLTVLEVTVSVSLMAVLAMITVPQLTNASGQQDAPAKATLSAILDVEVLIRQQDGMFSDDPVRVGQLLPGDRLTVTDDSSGGPAVASLHVDEDGALGAAAFAGDTGCWFVVVDGASVTWAVADRSYSCTGANALTLVPAASEEQPGLGSDPNKPLLIAAA